MNVYTPEGRSKTEVLRDCAGEVMASPDPIGRAFAICLAFNLRLTVTPYNVKITRYTSPHEPFDRPYYTSEVRLAGLDENKTTATLGAALKTSLIQYCNAVDQGIAAL